MVLKRLHQIRGSQTTFSAKGLSLCTGYVQYNYTNLHLIKLTFKTDAADR